MPETQDYEDRFAELDLEQKSWVPHWKEIRDNILPYRGLFSGEKPNIGTKERYADLVDPTALLGIRTLGAGMVGGLTSPSRPWFRLRFQDEDLNRRAAVKSWLRTVETKMYSIYSQSNFYAAIQMTYEEEGAFGTACHLQLPHWGRVVHFVPQTCGTYMLGTDQYGMVDSLFRTVWLTARSCARRFGEDKLSHAVREAAKNSPNQWIEVRHAVQPNNQRDGNAFDNQNMPFESAYWVKGEDQLLRKSGYHEFPAPSPRWGQTPGVYGWSPGMDVLSSQKILHEMDIGVLDAQQKELDPPVIRPPGFKHRLRTGPGEQNEIDPKYVDNVKRLYDFRFDYPGTLQLMDRKERQVLQILYYDLFLMLANEADRQKTATEVIQLHEEKLIQLGPTIDRQFHELLDPTTDRTFQEGLRRGLFPPWPEELNDAEMQVEYISMLAQAQQMVGTKAVNAYTGFVGGLARMQIEAQREPTALDRLDIDKACEEYGDMTGVTPAIVVPIDKAMSARQQRAAARQQEAQRIQEQQDAATVSQLSKADTEGKNALTDLQRTMQGA
jgi:hypothetical protein